MENINFSNDNEQLLASEDHLDVPMEDSDNIVQLSPECFSLVGGGSGILNF